MVDAFSLTTSVTLYQTLSCKSNKCSPINPNHCQYIESRCTLLLPEPLTQCTMMPTVSLLLLTTVWYASATQHYPQSGTVLHLPTAHQGHKVDQSASHCATSHTAESYLYRTKHTYCVSCEKARQVHVPHYSGILKRSLAEYAFKNS
jgi:hypothetical protein